MAPTKQKYEVNLHSVQNTACTVCRRDQRRGKTNDQLCTEVQSAIDGLPVRCVGKWAYLKIYRLLQYFGIFTQGMKHEWGKLNYIEICSGPGRCVLREDGEEIDGTALAIVQHTNFSILNSALFIDFNDYVVEILNQRFRNLSAKKQAKAVLGNFTDIEGMKRILSSIPSGLNLVFIDPTECDVPFDTIRCINDTLRKTDFIINVAIGTDFNRNVVNAATKPAYHKVRSKYLSFLGDDTFFDRPDVIEKSKQNKNQELRALFRERYKEKLAEIGLTYVDERPVKNYYSLVFASAHRRGLDFWSKANRYEPSQQKTLPFF